MPGSATALLLTFAALLAPSIEAAPSPVGAIQLDNYTFDKVLKIPGYDKLMKFDRFDPYGPAEDEFKQLCRQAVPVEKLLIGEVQVGEYGIKENDKLRKKFGLKRTDYPAYFLFNEANPTGLRYTGDTQAEDIVVWLRRHQIRVPLMGGFEELDALAKQFMKEGFADKHLKKAEELGKGMYGSYPKARIYAEVMQKIKEQGEDYVASEMARLHDLMDGSVKPEEKGQLYDKLKVLSVFAKDEL